ncbi:MAG TPA: lipid-A-disaccharide synthase, partial [Pseudomonadales bacterium]|nr:lipid-A-disaccharide synthase [Pseudomonadales bacterium]
MMTLYPFETEVYEANDINVAFVGHPKAGEIDPDPSPSARQEARGKLGYANSDRVVAILPGSRGAEVRYSGPDFLAAAEKIAAKLPDTRFLIPAANEKRKAQIEELVAGLESNLDVKIIDGESTLAMQASDVVLVNSGTATLEAMLLKRPMVMSYRLAPISYAIVIRLVTTRWFALPNILAQKELVPEFIQDAATPDALADAVIRLLEDPAQPELLAEFHRIHQMLRQNSGERAAAAILQLCGREG